MLDAALTTAAGDGGVALALTVTNEGDDPVTLRFRTGQRADFAAYDDSIRGDDGDRDADPVWRHAEGRLFTQVLGSETLEPSESTAYKATWKDPPSGEYRIVGEVTAEECGLTATATVEVD